MNKVQTIKGNDLVAILDEEKSKLQIIKENIIYTARLDDLDVLECLRIIDNCKVGIMANGGNAATAALFQYFSLLEDKNKYFECDVSSKSSHISIVEYDYEDKTVTIVFNSEAVYAYFPVEANYAINLCLADSPGTYFHKVIKNTSNVERVS